MVHFVAGAEGSHAAVVVGKSLGGSVQRHRRQRQIRHALSSVWNDVPAGDLVVRGLPGDTDYEQVRADLQRAVSRL